MDRNDLTPMEWIQHLQEELMDAVVYLQKIKNLERAGEVHPNHGRK
jgi:hypothetical protein